MVHRFTLQETGASTPATEMQVNSLLTTPAAGTRAGRPIRRDSRDSQGWRLQHSRYGDLGE